jgi:hypothetical protein
MTLHAVRAISRNPLVCQSAIEAVGVRESSVPLLVNSDARLRRIEAISRGKPTAYDANSSDQTGTEKSQGRRLGHGRIADKRISHRATRSSNKARLTGSWRVDREIVALRSDLVDSDSILCKTSKGEKGYHRDYQSHRYCRNRIPVIRWNR